MDSFMSSPLPPVSLRSAPSNTAARRPSNLTRRQLLMWIGQRLAPDAPDYNMPSLCWIEGVLDHNVLTRAVQRLAGEADALRTVVKEASGAPFQEVLPHIDVSVALRDLREEHDAKAATGAVLHDAEARASRALVMDRCLFDFALFLLPGGRSALYFNLHHIVGDGFSLALLYQRLSELYHAGEKGEEPFPSPLRPFPEHLRRELEFASSPAYREDEAWWAARLAPSGAALSLYGEAVRGESGPSEQASFDLGADLTGRLRALAGTEAFKGKNEHAAIQNMLCAALCAWLHRIGPNTTVTVGLTFHNRTEEQRSVIGLFMQILPVRVDIAAGETFRSLYAKVSEAVVGALQHRRVAVENPLHRRVWDVIMNYTSAAFGDFAGRRAGYEWVFTRHTNVALSVQLHDFNKTGALHVDLDMQRAAIPEAQRRPPAAAAGHLWRVLEALLSDPDRAIADVDILMPEERARLVEAGRGPSIPVRVDVLPAAFEEHAAQRGHAPAVVCGSKCLSYGAMNSAANRLARRLQRLGAGRNERVAVFLDRSPEMVTAVLAALKAGAGYVPLDTAYPPDRLLWMLEDCAPRVVITSSALRPLLEQCLPPGALPILLLIDADPLIAEESDANLDVAVRGDDLAYVIYTSGSTGRPKGVEIERRAMANFLEAMRGGDWVLPGETLLAISPLSFDAHVSHLHHPLVVGARVVLATREDTADARRLLSLLEEYDVAAMGATPTTWRMLIEAGWKGKPDLKVHCGGEALTPDLVQKLRPRVGVLWNVYGPTEATVLSTMHRVELNDGVIPVGRPIANTQLYVVDAGGRDVPEGVAGELLIGGEGVARGYLNRPELTAEKFVQRPEGRAYRTGDRVRFLPDGSIELMGRLDHQVKIRGYRIELGEIESELERHPSVARAVVIAREDAPGDRRLVAYVVPIDRAIAPHELRSFLQSRLPAFMVPAAFVKLERLPLSPNGKVDRAALQASGALAAEERMAMSVRPVDLLEYQLSHIFEEALGSQPIGRKDSFFEVGGSSLSAVRVLTRIEALLGRSVPMQTFFANPSVTRLAAVLREGGWAPSLDSLVPLEPHGSLPPFFCVHTFIGEVCRGLAGRFTFDRPFYGLQPRGLDGREAPLTSVEAMAEYYVDQIRRVRPRGPYHIGGYCFGGIVAFEMARQLVASGDEVARLVIIDAAPRNLPDGGGLGKVRAGINRGLYALERVADIVRSPDPASALWRAADRIMKRGLSSARGEDGALEALRARLDGLSSWPLAYQRIASVHYTALLRYVPGIYEGRLTLIRTNERLQRWGIESETWGWEHVARDVEAHRVPGRHDEIMNEPHVRIVAEILARVLSDESPSGRIS